MKRALASLVLFLASPLAAQDRQTIYPPGVAEQSEYADTMSRTLGMFGSQPLWSGDAMAGYKRRYRASFDGGSLITADIVQVAIDELDDGSAFVSGKVFTTRGEERENFVRPVPADEYVTFLARVEGSGLWQQLPESWRRRPNTFCAHGRYVVFEKHDGKGYGLSDAEHCTAPAHMVSLLDDMLDLADFESRSQWRPGMWWQ